MEGKGLVRPGFLDDQRFYFWRGTSKFLWKISIYTKEVPSMFCQFYLVYASANKKYCLPMSEKCPDVWKRAWKSLHSTVLFLSVWCS